MYNNSEFILLINPSKFQVNSEYFGGYEIISRDLQDLIISWSEKNNISTIDMLPEIKKQDNLNIFYKIDTHYTKKGNEIVAKEIYKTLKTMQ